MTTDRKEEEPTPGTSQCPMSTKKLPGPAGYFCVGNLPQTRFGRTPITWTRWSEEFGAVYGISLGPMGDAIVLSGADELATTYEPGSENDTNFRDRWRPPVLDKIGFAGSLSWENWLEGAKERKQLLHEILKCIDMERLLKKEVEAVCDVLSIDKDHVDICDLLNQANNNILLTFTINRGDRFEYKDEEFQKLAKVIETNNKHKLKGSPVNMIQWLWHTPLSNSMYIDHARVQAALQPYIDSHRDTLEIDNIRDLIDGYLGGIGDTSFDPKEVINNVNHLFPFLLALSSAMQWTILFVIHDVDIQRKIHEEIDEVIADGDFTDDIVIKTMPYMNAVIKESLRLATPVAQLLPHCPVNDANIDGFHITKGTTTFSNLWGPNHDAETWPEPLLFKPDRWLDKEDYPTGFIPFGSGLRKCSGDKLSMTALRVFLVTIFKKFHLRGVEGENLPDLEDSFMWADTILPNHFNVVVKNRHSTEIN